VDNESAPPPQTTAQSTNDASRPWWQIVPETNHFLASIQLGSWIISAQGHGGDETNLADMYTHQFVATTSSGETRED
jgi:hypothetical protein